jgi:hypothetical protein
MPPATDSATVFSQLLALLERIRFEDEILRDAIRLFRPYVLGDEGEVIDLDLGYIMNHSRDDLITYMLVALKHQDWAAMLRDLLVEGRVPGYLGSVAATFHAGELLVEWTKLNPTLSVIGPALSSFENARAAGQVDMGTVDAAAAIESISRTLNILATA